MRSITVIEDLLCKLIHICTIVEEELTVKRYLVDAILTAMRVDGHGLNNQWADFLHSESQVRLMKFYRVKHEEYTNDMYIDLVNAIRNYGQSRGLLSLVDVLPLSFNGQMMGFPIMNHQSETNPHKEKGYHLYEIPIRIHQWELTVYMIGRLLDNDITNRLYFSNEDIAAAHHKQLHRSTPMDEWNVSIHEVVETLFRFNSYPFEVISSGGVLVIRDRT